jgi:DHA1 family bicyclomycin/chloramphenicol resistance-like MFS transporter
MRHLRPNSTAMTVVLSLLTSLGPLSTDLYLPSLPAITVALGSTVSQTQLTLSAFLAGFAVGQIFYGSLSDAYGRKPVLAGGLVLFCVASLGCALAPNIETLIAFRFLQAFGGSGPVVLARAMVRDLYEGPAAARQLARMGMIMGVVPAVAPIAGGVLEALVGWRANFVATLAFGLVMLAIALGRLPETIRRRTGEVVSPATVIRGFAHLFRHPAYRTYVGIVTLTYSGLFAWISGSSFILQGVYGLSEIAFALSFTLVVGGFMGGSMLTQRLVRAIGAERTIGFGMICLAGGGGLMLLFQLVGVASPFALLLPMACYTCGVGMTLPSSTALAMAPFPDRAGAASSSLGLCQMTGAAIVGAVVGRVLGGSALPIAITVATTGGLALLLFWSTASRRRSPV